MYQITEKFRNQGERQKALKLTKERAFETKGFDVVVKVAKDLNPTSQSAPVLMRAVQLLADNAEESEVSQ